MGKFSILTGPSLNKYGRKHMLGAQLCVGLYAYKISFNPLKMLMALSPLSKLLPVYL